MDQAGTSGVTVEYTDSSGIFADIEPHFKDRIPLRNLHWKSPSRPLRSIDSLQVNLVPGSEKRPASDVGGAHRRHQIPGLRQTPYLKIYFLRCDDNETYKASSRRLIREWLKDHTPSSQSTSSVNNQENHDAFEWLIVHVVYPDTPAASQSRSSSTASAARASNEKVGSTKWPGRGSATVFEKIKADFNGSSKSTPDRVTQIRIPRPTSQPRIRPSGVEVGEQDEAWTDLTTKLKSLILTSFDLRVSQYEEDIREKDSQRNLPGWNFCTFFILKEGLARGFENVGLFEDALIGYDELAIGLDVIVRDQTDETEAAPGGTFLGYSESLQKDLQALINHADNEEPKIAEESAGKLVSLKLKREEYPLNVDQKPYRELILANNVSIFDVRAYIFTRQLNLLLKAANATSLRLSLDGAKQDQASVDREKQLAAEDLLTLAETCRRATEFISIGARSLRNDLEHGIYKQHDANEDDRESLRTETLAIDHMVKSWTFAVALQVLDQTSTEGLSIPASALAKSNELAANQAVHGNYGDLLQAKPSNSDSHVPARKSSLPNPPPKMQRPSSQEMFSPDLDTASSGLHNHENASGIQDISTSTLNRTGTEDLASWRAEVFLMARHVLQDLARKRRWHIDCTGLKSLYDEVSLNGFEDVPLDDTSSSVNGEENGPLPVSSYFLASITPKSLQRVVKSQAALRVAYEQLTDLSLRHLLAANRTRSAERVFADMAVLKFRSDDFASAASYFHQVTPFYGGTHWRLLEGTMLELYARCLKKLDRQDDYVQVLLKLLPKYVTEIRRTPSGAGSYHHEKAPSHGGSGSSDLVADYIRDLFVYSQELSKEIFAPLGDFFGGLEIAPRIWHCAEKDGFQLHFKMCSLLGNNMQVQKVRVRLIESADVSPRELWLESQDPILIKAVPSAVVVESNVSLRGKYVVDKIEVRSNNLLFRHDDISQALLPREFRDAPGFDPSNLEQALSVVCYPCSEGLQVQVRPPSHIHLAESRSFEVEIRSGWNNISEGQLNIRSGTAGLRIKLADAKIVNGTGDIREATQPGTIEFLRIDAGSFATIKVPYSLENDPTSLNFKLELTYSTETGDFSYSANTSIPSILPVSVNVQDMFRDSALFSRFTVVPATLVPLRVLKCQIDSGNTFEVVPALTEQMVMDVFPRQPASLLYKFVRRSRLESSKKPLALTMDFRCLDDEVLGSIERRFSSAIENSEFKQYSQLLVPHLLATFRTSMTASDLETIGLVREVELPSYDEVSWDRRLLGLGRDLQKDLKQWLQSWHETNTIIALPETREDIASLTRRIVIPVDIPQVRVVHTAELRIIAADDRQALVGVGQPIAAELRIKHTLDWGSTKPEASAAPTDSENESEPLEFAYEVHANPEVWLVGGKRRGNFQARENEVHTFPIMLLPQRHGHLLLPGLDIKAFELHANTSRAPLESAGLPPPRKPLQSETDYRNHGESILVLPDLRSTTVSLDPGGPSGGSWLVESERRAELANA